MVTACLVALLIACPAAAAPDEPSAADLTVRTTTFSDDVVARGSGTAMVLTGGPGPAIISGALEASNVLIEHQHGAFVSVGPASTPLKVHEGQFIMPRPDFIPLTNATIEIVANDPQFRIHVLAPLDGPTFNVQSRGTEVEYHPVNRLLVDMKGLRQAPEPDRLGVVATASAVAGEVVKVFREVQGPWNLSFTPTTYEGDWIIANAGGGDNTFSLHGDLILEIYGVTIRASNATQSVEIETGSRNEPLNDDADVVVGAVARYSNETFVRLYMKQAHANLQVVNPEGSAQYAMDRAAAATEGRVLMQAAQGRIHHGGQATDIGPRTYIVEGRYAISVAGKGEQMRLTLDRQPESGTLEDLIRPVEPASSQQVRTTSPIAPLAIVGSAILLLVAGTAARVWAMRRLDQDDLEAALESQEFGRAARIGQQLLRRDYGNEEAAIGRAIALTKAGAPNQAIVELHERFHEGDPSDGVLHYVLGMAHLALDQREQARSAFSEAVRRTPDLLQDIQANPDTAAVLPRPPANRTGPFGSGSAYV